MQRAPFNPFPGLRSFQIDEEFLFFGREGQSEELLRRLRANRLLAVIGTSGSGKSSLIQAGLLPYLYGGFMVGTGSHWRVAHLRPGNDPIGNLAAALNDPKVLGLQDGAVEESEPSRILQEVTLRRSALGLIEAVRLARLPERERVLIIVDQFEELFRFAGARATTHQQDDAAAFVKLLLEATSQDQLPIYVVLTMRSEFIGDCAKFKGLPEAVTAGPYLIPWMTREQRRSAIEEPVRVAHGQITTRLVNRLLNDGDENPDQLPILQHCLMQTWDCWKSHHGDHDPVDLEHYLQVGGIDKALSKHADAAYVELSTERLRVVARRMFQALTERGSDNREIRRPTAIAKIAAEAEADIQEIIAIAEHFRAPGRAFLMPPKEVCLGETTILDISHESLIRGWDRLKTWVDEESASAKFYRRIAEWAENWANKKAALWVNPDLQNALDWADQERPNSAWAERYHPGFAQAITFLNESRKTADLNKETEERIKLEEDRRKAEELRRTRSHLRLVRSLCLLLILAVLLAGWVASRYEKERNSYEKERDLKNELATRFRDNQQLALESTLTALTEINHLSDSDPQSQQRAKEDVLQKAKSVSAQILQQDTTNSEANMVHAISLSMLSDLHSNGYKDKQLAIQECNQNMAEARHLSERTDPRHDLKAAGFLLASSAERLYKLGDKETAQNGALQATQLLQEAAVALPSTDASGWEILAASYHRAVVVLTRDRPNRSTRDLLDDLRSSNDNLTNTVLDVYIRDTSGGSPSSVRDVEGSKTTLISDIRKVASLEMEWDKKQEALVTYDNGETLANELIRDPSASIGLLDAAFWLFSEIGNTYAEESSWNKAATAYNHAESSLKRFPDGSDEERADTLAYYYFIGHMKMEAALAEKDEPSKIKGLRDALAIHEHGRKVSRDGPDESFLVTALQLAIAEDYLMLGDDTSADKLVQQRATFLRDHISTGEVILLGDFYDRALLKYERHRDYRAARDWADRGIKELGIGGGGSYNDKSDQVLTILSGLYGSRSWLDLFLGDFKMAITDANTGYKLDNTQYWILTNEAHGYLFSGDYRRAKKIYLRYKYMPAHEKKSFLVTSLDDFNEFLDHGSQKMNLSDVRKMQRELSELEASPGLQKPAARDVH